VAEDEEARLVFAGAVAAVRDAPDPIAVCDVGGGSTELAVGTRADGALWVRSLPVGSANPPDGSFLDGVSPPPAASVLATGGTARSLARLVGPELGDEELARARKLVEAGELAGIPTEREATLPAGIAILGELQQLYSQPLRVADAGFREGALLGLL
jgi:exopolyphosphatase/guanosine-5'-triphosphate,3'-diphosphate pyrophosphatase